MTEPTTTERSPTGHATGNATAGPVVAVAGRRPSVRRLVRATAGHRGLLARALALLVPANAVVLVVPAVVGRLVDLVGAGAPGWLVVAVTAGLVAAAVLAGVLLSAGLTALGELVEVVCTRLRQDAFDGVLAMPLTRLEAAGTGDLLSRVAEDMRVVAEALRTATPFALDAALSVVVTAGFFVVLDYRLAVAVVVGLPVHAWAVRWYLPRSEPVYRQQRESYARHQERTISIASELATITRFGLGPAYVERYRLRSADVADRHRDAVHLQTRFFGRINLAEPVVLLAVLGVGAWLYGAGEITGGELTAAALYVLALFNPINQLLYFVDTAQSALTALRRVVGLLPADEAPPPGALPAGAGRVTLTAVGHSYPGRPHAVADVSVDVEAGSLTLVVGRSGSGKSTLVKVIAGLLEPDTGEIHLDGVARSPAELAGRVAMVTQDVVAFSGTLRWNLLLGSTGTTTDDRLREALAAVGAASWVAELEAGLDTEIGRTGTALTVAQLQQVALARLSGTTARVLVLDEPTSALGGADALQVEAAVRRLAQGRTVFLVAHRLSLAPVADRVLVLDRGRVVESGPHEDLLAAGGAYRELWAAWAAGRGV